MRNMTPTKSFLKECRNLQFLNLIVLISHIIDVNGLDISGFRSFTFCVKRLLELFV